MNKATYLKARGILTGQIEKLDAAYEVLNKMGIYSHNTVKDFNKPIKHRNGTLRSNVLDIIRMAVEEKDGLVTRDVIKYLRKSGFKFKKKSISGVLCNLVREGKINKIKINKKNNKYIRTSNT